MRRFRIRRARHSVGRLQRIRQARALPRPTGIHLPQPSSAKTKLPQRTVPAQQTNEHAGVTDSQIRPDKIRSFCPSAAKMNGSSPLSRPKETIFAPRPPFARNTVQIVHPAPQKTRRIARYVPQGSKRAILRNSHPAANIRPASRQRSTCEKRPPSLAQPLIGLPPAHRGPCPWPNAHRAPGAARAQALPHPGRRAWCAPP